MTGNQQQALRSYLPPSSGIPWKMFGKPPVKLNLLRNQLGIDWPDLYLYPANQGRADNSYHSVDMYLAILIKEKKDIS